MFVSRIKELRTALGLSQTKISKKSNCSQMHISYIERNIKSVTLRLLVSIAKAMNVCVYDLFNYECYKYKTCTKKGREFLNCCEKNKK